MALQDNGQALNQSTSTQHVSRGGFGMTRKPFRRAKTSGKHCGGPSVLIDVGLSKPHLISPDGVWSTSEDTISSRFAHAYPGKSIMEAYKDIATRLSGAAGKIYIEICQCVGQAPLHRTDPSDFRHSRVQMSGFWIQGARFVTCAHFLEVLSLSEEQKKTALLYQNLQEFSGPGRFKAVVSSQDKVTGGVYSDPDSKQIPVDLIRIDQESDLAVFQVHPFAQFSPNEPPVGLEKDDFATINDCDITQGGYTIGYYTYDKEIENLQPYDEQILTTLWPRDDNTRPTTYFPLKYAGATQKRDDSVQFADVFEYPNHRTISTGEFGSGLSSHKYCTFTICRISAWYQSSGGLVGGFRSKVSTNGHQQYRPVVCGVFRGDEGPDNVFAALNSDGIDWLFNGSESETAEKH